MDSFIPESAKSRGSFCMKYQPEKYRALLAKMMFVESQGCNNLWCYQPVG